MKLKTSVAILVLVVLGLFAALSASLIRSSDLLDSGARDLAMAGESIRVAEELKSRLLIHNRNAFLYSLRQEPQRRETRRTQTEEITGLIETMSLLATNDRQEVSVLADLEEEITTYLENRRQLRASNLSATEQYNQISEDVDQAIAVVDKLIDMNRAQMRDLVTTTTRQNETARMLALALLTLGSIILFGLILAIFAYAARPLSRLAEVIKNYGEGQRTERADPKGLLEIREIASNFNAMADHLEERRQDQLRFIASIAHDLRNPLHSITLIAELLVHKSKDKERELAGVVLRQVENLDRLVLDLLDTSRVEAGHLDLQVKDCDINTVVADSVELNRGGADFHRFALDPADEPIVCRCDYARLCQVLNNLLSNAVKYSPNGGTVRVEIRRKGDHVVISVTDWGIGIAREDLGRIFKPFHRTAVTRETIPGVGLGLSASRRIVEAHGGVLRVESEPGKGSTFQLILPCRGPANQA